MNKDKVPKSVNRRRQSELVPLEELARQQGVQPLSVDEHAKLWPGDDDAEQLLAFILSERAERRALGAKANHS